MNALFPALRDVIVALCIATPAPPLRVVVLLLALLLLLGGCTAVPVWKQERVSKPNMVFNDGGAFVYGPRLHAQLEPGSADSGGATAAGCTACR